MGLRESLNSYVKSLKAGVGSPDQLVAELNSIKRRSSSVLTLCLILLAAIVLVTLYLAVLNSDFQHIGALIAADGVLVATLGELMRRAYRDMIGSGYILTMAAVSSEAQTAEIVSEILKRHFS